MVFYEALGNRDTAHVLWQMFLSHQLYFCCIQAMQKRSKAILERLDNHIVQGQKMNLLSDQKHVHAKKERSI